MAPRRPGMDLARWEREMDDGRVRVRSWWPERWFRVEEMEPRVPAVDAYEEKDDVVAKAELPRIDKNDIQVNLTDHMLTIEGEKKKAEEIKEENSYRSERSYGSFMRAVDLPRDVQADKITANFKDGILEVRLPKTEEGKNKEIRIKVD